MDDEPTILKLRQPHFGHVASNKKKVDGRVYFEKLRRLKPGCIIKYVLGQKFVLKRLVSLKTYDGFRAMLRQEGVRTCLPGLKEKDLDKAVKVYNNIQANGIKYEVLATQKQVVALRLGEVTFAPYRQLSRTEVSALGKILKPQTRSQWLTRIATGSFCNVYKIKRVEDVLSGMKMVGKKKLETTLKNTAVRILKASISKTVRSYEIRANDRSLKLS